MRNLTEHEWEVLEMLAGERRGEWGAWVSECCEALVSYGYAVPLYKITAAGKKALADRKIEKPHD